MVVNIMPEITAWLPSMNHAQDAALQLQSMLPINLSVVAQTIKDPDLMGNVQKTFNHFIQSGQLWALLIGLIIGYMIRGLTTYG